MKELDEARKKIDQIILRYKAGEMVREKARKRILSLKGDGWRIAIVKEDRESTIADTGTSGFPILETYRYKAVIWQAEE